MPHATRHSLLCALAALLLAFPLRSDAEIHLEAKPGFQGQVARGGTAPCRITVEGQNTSFKGTVELAVQYGSHESTYRRYLELSPPSFRKELWLPFLPYYSKMHSEVVLRLRTETGEIFQEKPVPFEVVEKGETLGLSVSAREERLFPEEEDPDDAKPNPKIHWLTVKPEELPDFSEGLESLRKILLYDIASEDLSGAQWEALTQWLHLGGQVLVAGRARLERFRGEWYARHLPITPDQVAYFPSLDGIGAYGLKLPKVLQPFPVLTGTLKPNAGAQFVQDDVPLVSGRVYGEGSVLFLAADPLSEPFASWPDGEPFLERMAAFNARRWPLAASMLDSIVQNPQALTEQFFTFFFFFGALYVLAITLAGWACRQGGWPAAAAPLRVLLAGIFLVLGFLYAGSSRPMQQHLQGFDIIRLGKNGTRAEVISRYFFKSYQSKLGNLQFPPSASLPVEMVDDNPIFWQSARDTILSLDPPLYSLSFENIPRGRTFEFNGVIPVPEDAGWRGELEVSDEGTWAEGSLVNSTPWNFTEVFLLTAQGTWAPLGKVAAGEWRDLHLPLSSWTDPAYDFAHRESPFGPNVTLHAILGATGKMARVFPKGESGRRHIAPPFPWVLAGFLSLEDGDRAVPPLEWNASGKKLKKVTLVIDTPANHGLME